MARISVKAAARSIALIVGCVGASGVAHAQVEGPQVRAMRINIDGQGMLEVDSARNAPLGKAVLGAQVEYLSRPLVVRGGDGKGDVLRELVYERLQIGLGGAMRLWKNLTVIGFIPMAAFQNGSNPPLYGEGRGPLKTSAMGDAVVALKYVFAAEKPEKLGYGLLLPISFPTATPNSYMGKESVAIEPTAVASMASGHWRWAANLGVSLHEARQTYYLKQGSSAVASVGASYNSDAASGGLSRYWFDTQVRYSAPIHGGDSFKDIAQHNLELIAALRIPMGRGLFLNVGSGFGLLPGVGVPAVRPFAHLQYRAGESDKGPPKPLFDPLGVPRSGT